MSTKSPKKVDLKRLAAALGDYRFAYLVTVDDDYRVHTVTVEPELREDVLDVGVIGGQTRKNVEGRSDVTLLWPPSEPGGYSLIVDGRAAVADPTDSDDDGAASFEWYRLARCCTAMPTRTLPDPPPAACTTVSCFPLREGMWATSQR